jgi:hypothetical protein
VSKSVGLTAAISPFFFALLVIVLSLVLALVHFFYGYCLLAGSCLHLFKRNPILTVMLSPRECCGSSCSDSVATSRRMPFQSFLVVFLLLTQATTCLLAEAETNPMHCRLPDINAEVVPGTSRRFVEYSPVGPNRGIGNTLIYFPVIYWFAVFSGRDIAISDLSSVGSVCRILNCGFPFTSEVKKKFPDLKLAKSPVVKNMHLIEHFKSNTTYKNDIMTVNGYSAVAFHSFIGNLMKNDTFDCVKQLSGCFHQDFPKDLECMEHFALRQHFPGGIRSASMLPESVVGLPDSTRQALVQPLPPASKIFHAAVHIRAQLVSLEQKGQKVNSTSPSLADFNLYNESIFPLVSRFLTDRFYAQPNTAVGNFSVTSPPRVFVSVDDITLKRLLVQHLRDYRDPLYPLHVIYVNNSGPIKHARLMRHTVEGGAGGEESHFPGDVDMIPAMFDWYGIAQAEFTVVYRYDICCGGVMLRQCGNVMVRWCDAVLS